MKMKRESGLLTAMGNWAELQIDDDNHDDLIPPEVLMRAATAIL